jgi:tetratricopeptide (TPR) repeat protein
MSNLPREGVSQEIGRLAGDALGVKRPRAWISKEQDGDTDFGLDYLIQLKSVESDVSFSFYLQLKGTTVPSYSADNQYVSYDFKVETLKYYHQQEPLVMVAVVDLKDNEEELWKCPIYYFWLEDDWFFDNTSKLESQKTISVKIPTSQILDKKLDIYDFYSRRITEKFKVSELKREIQPHSQDVAKSIGALAEAISTKPIFLKATENIGDEPWIENPKGELPTLMKSCADSLNSNQLDKATELLGKLEVSTSDFTSHELAEFYYQKATYFSLQADYLKANEYFKLATEHSNKDRYRLGFIESKFKLETLPDDKELTQLANSLPVVDYRNVMTKCKCLALLGRVEEALDILKSKFPERLIGQLLILTLSRRDDEIDRVIESIDENQLDNDRENYTFHSFAARRLYVKANSGEFVYEKVLPIQGQASLNVEDMKAALLHMKKAWDYARKLGYPSDITILFDISPFIFGYFNKLDELFYHFEEIIQERPNNTDLIQIYSRLLFNKENYEKTIELITRIKPNLNGDDCGLLILSHYHLKKSRIALGLIKDYESNLLADIPENIALIFCLGAEMANDLLEEELAEKYLKIVKGFDNGGAILAISTFIKNVNETPKDRDNYVDKLYEDYHQLDKPIEIAEQLFRVLNPMEKSAANRLIELANDIRLTHELFEKDYFRLAEAYITISDYESALSLAVKHIDKGDFDPYWQIIQSVCFQLQGKPGLAHEAIKGAIEGNQFSNEHLRHYVNICLKLGLLDNVETALIDLFDGTNQREEKLSFLSNLISIYSSSEGNETKLNNAIRRFGKLVLKDNCTEEGQFLMYFLMSPKNDDVDEVKDFQDRLACYTRAFPDSPILKQGSLDIDGGAESMLDSIHKMAGITDDQIEKWEQNKLKIRNGSLPVPFFMLERFLSDSRDIFTSWVLSMNSPEEHLEFKLKQAPQLDQIKFNDLISRGKSFVIEDTSLLILNELDLLDLFLEATTEFCLLDSTFERITKNNHPLAGSIYSRIPQKILDSINKHKTKLVLHSSGELTPIEAYKEALIKHNSVIITDDVNLLKMVSLASLNQVTSANSFNIIEYLSYQESITLDDKYNLVSKLCSLGIYQPNMTLNLLTDSLSYFTNVVDGIDYSETEFKAIFDKIFSGQRDTVEVIDLFLRTIFYAVENSNFKLHSNTLIALFRGLLIRHSYKDFAEFSAFWFVYLSMVTRVITESPVLSTSSRHVELWKVYQEIIIKVQEGDFSDKGLIINIVQQIFMLGEQSRELAYKNIKHCFTPLTDESELFDKIFQEVAVSHKLFELRQNK